MKKIILLFCALSTVSCASISNLIKEATERNQRIEKGMESYVYKMEPSKLKTQVIASWSGWQAMPATQKEDEKLQEQLNSGFSYNGKFFQKKDPSLFDFITALSSQDKMLMDDLFTTKDYFVLEENPTSFTMIRNAHIYEAKQIAPGETKLKISRITYTEHGPWQLKPNIMGLLSKHGHLVLFARGPIILEKSVETAKRSYHVEFNTLKNIDDGKAKEIETGIL